MGTELSILVPFRGDGSYRSAAWKWVRARLEAIVPDAEIVVGTSPIHLPFNTSAAVNDAASRAGGEMFCVHDAEVALPAEWYAEARERRDTWSISEGSRYLTQEASAELLRLDPTTDELPMDTDVDEAVEFSAGGVVMVSREGFDRTGGKDPRFTGWGPEDGAWAMALETLVGPRNRFGGPLLHIWHPREPNTRPWPPGSPELLARYQAANGDPEAMREVCAR